MNVLVADDDEGMRFMLSQLCTREGYTVKEVTDGEQAVTAAEREDFDVIVLDIRMPRMNGLEALERIRSVRPETPIIIVTAYGSEEVARRAISLGAYDYFTKGEDDTEELRIVIKRAIERRNLQKQIEALQRQLGSLEERLKETKKYGELIGFSKPMLEVYDLIQRVGPSDVTVLIMGESGTGKELVAQAIVEHSSRRDMPFIKVNCAAIPETLLESELFGHERGAFTGAVASKPGKFELADKGTIFLDEIGDLSPSLQAKLLRVLQEHEFERVGGTRPIKVDLRVIAATNVDVARRVAEKKFREDLFFRLNVVPIKLPPLRERTDDLPLLVEHFVKRFSRRFGKKITGVAPEVMEIFLNHSWPGNVRELENVIQRACVLARGPQITVESLPAELREGRSGIPTSAASGGGDKIALPDWFDDFSIPLSKKIEYVLESAEKKLIERALERSGNRRQAAADLLGISRKSLHNKIVKYGLAGDRDV